MVRRLLIVGLLLCPGLAAGQPQLRTLTEPDLAALGQLLDRGQVAFVESDNRGWLKQVSVVTRVQAPLPTVFGVVADVARYPEFLHNFSRIDVTSRHGDSVSYDWDWRGVLFDFHGSNTMNLYPPRRIDVMTNSGDLGVGRFVSDFRTLSTGQTLMSTTLYTDPRRSNWVARQLISANPSMLHAMNLSVGIVFLMGIKARAESPGGRGSVAAPGRGGGTLQPVGDLDTARILPLLRRGELALIETGAQRGLRQATVFAWVDATAERIREVVEDPARYPSFISNVESSDVVARGVGSVTYDLELDFPIFDVESRMEMARETSGRIMVASPEGDMRGGRWTWEFPSAGVGSVAAHGGYNDMRRSGWLMRRLISMEPYFDHALNVSSRLVMVRAVRRRAQARP